MNIFLTFDYELFFGENPGSVEKCMLEPTNDLLRIGQKHNVCYTFFIDVGYLIKLEEYSSSYPELAKDLNAVKEQINVMQTLGHSVQLHIHPHWEKSSYGENGWQIVTKDAYKLADFSDKEVDRIVRSYKAYLDNLLEKPTEVFRAGGWCIQPFHRWAALFQDLNIRIDSSVIVGGKFDGGEYSFDFTKAPIKANYRFSTDESIEDVDGFFTEYPIASIRYSPLFFWRLYILGRLFPAQHKMIGDGKFLAQPGRKKSILTSFTDTHVSSDGYFASQLKKGLIAYQKRQFTDFVVIGHPKGNTRFSVRQLDRFIRQYARQHSFLGLK
jgi:peptidoglycan/xylan/chitin deacetylase (PgdA/CDA1 family)